VIALAGSFQTLPGVRNADVSWNHLLYGRRGPCCFLRGLQGSMADTLPDILAGVAAVTLGFVMWIFKRMGAGERKAVISRLE